MDADTEIAAFEAVDGSKLRLQNLERASMAAR
jgi:hypothetical protein